MRSLLLIATALFFSANAYSDESLDYAKRYIVEVNKNSSPVSYSQYWREKVRTHLHNTPAKLQRELDSSARIHELFLKNGGVNIPPMVLAHGVNVISYTFRLNTPITVQEEDRLALLYPGWVYKEFQIVVEKEGGAWKIAGETFIGEEK